MKRWAYRLVTVAAAVTVLAAGVLLFVCWQCGIWSWRDWQIYKAMSRECHPVWRDLQAGQIRAGDDVEDVIWRTHPRSVERFEDVTMLTYQSGFTGLGIVAKNGRLVSAGAASCTWDRTFFDVWDPQEKEAFYNRYSAHLNAKWKAMGLDP